jgi:hypothetical protein
MYSLPQEIEVWYIIPAIRKEFSRILTQKYKLTFEKTGEILGISKAAVSQYLKKKRAVKIKLPKEIKKEIEKSSEIIVKKNNLAVREMLRILKLMRKKGCECNICKKYNKGVMKHCLCNPKIRCD